MEVQTIIEEGSVVSAGRDHMRVKYQGFDVHVFVSITRRSCKCCADTTEFNAMYNDPSAVDGDPLGIE